MDTYEKKYNEALKDMKAIYPNLKCDARLAVEHAFPELRESEDERIINQLITLVNSAGEVLFIPTNKEELIAWLNKCKESLHISETCKENPNSFTDEDERIRKELIETIDSIENFPNKCAAIAYLEKQKEHSMSAEEVLTKAGLKPYKDGNQWCILAGDNIQEGICGFGDTIDEALYQFLMEVLEKQKEQKPVDFPTTDEEVKEFLETHSKVEVPEKYKTPDFVFSKQEYESHPIISKDTTSVKPVERSEADKKTISDACCWIAEYAGYLMDKNYGKASMLMGLTDKLKSLRPQPQEEIYQAAKHALAIKFMNYLDENRPEGKMSLSNSECEDIDKAFKENDWEKIIRYSEKYKPHWKPSEEQMEALEECGECMRCIKELYEQLNSRN